MIKRLLFTILFSLIAVPAFAACTPGFIATPGSGSNQTFSTKAAADTNCESLFDIDTSSQLHNDLTAALPVNVSSTPTAVTGSTVGSLTGAHVLSLGQYPAGAVPYTASATGTTAATTATLTGAASVTTYLCGFSIRANATAAATGNATVTGTITGTLNYTQWTAPLASGLGVTEQIFTPCIPASAANTSIAVVSAAPGSGGTVSVTAWGYKL